MKRFLLVLLLCVLFACVGCACADAFNPNTYPGADPEGTSYWAECKADNYWSPNDGMNDVSRFSIAGTMGYIDGKFTSDSGRILDDSAVHYRAAVADYIGVDSDEVIAYDIKGINAGYVFVSVGDRQYKIRTADGNHWLKRNGGSTNYSLIETDSEEHATPFNLRFDLTDWKIYEDPSSGTGYYGIVLKSGKLSLKYYSSYLDIKPVALYRRAYCPDTYLHGDFVLWGDSTYVPANAGEFVYYGPYTFSDTQTGSSPQKVKIPCYYRDKNNLEMLDFPGYLDAIPCVEGVTVKSYPPPEYYYLDQVIGWRIVMPDAPTMKNRELYFTVPVVFQEHDFNTHNNQVNGVLYSTSDCWLTGKEPTCTEDGFRYRPCMNYVNWEIGPDQSQWGLNDLVCHEYQISETLPATGHNIEEIVFSIPPRCETAAYIQGPCTKCGQTNARIYDPSRPALGHDLELRPAKAPTCTEAGNEAYYICVRSNCPWIHSGFYITDTNGNRIFGVPTVPIDPDAHAYENRFILNDETGTLTASRVCVLCGNVESLFSVALAGHGSEADPWQIGSADVWDFFSSATQNGFDIGGMHFVLTCNIAVSTMIGTRDHQFSGTFDGANHTLTVTLSGTENYIAPFRYVNGAAFEHLRVAGTVNTSAGSASGLVGSGANVSVTDCVVDVDITSTAGGGHSGFVAMCGGTVSVTGSAFTGSITGESAGYCAGFLGWAGSTADDCVYDGAMNTGSASNDFIRTNNYANNCYSINADGIERVKAKLARSVTAAEGVTIDFGTPTATYTTSGITAYPTGLMYNGVFYAGEGQTVALSLTCEALIGFAAQCTASSGVLTSSGGNWTLAMPGEDVLISAVYTHVVFGSATFILPNELTAIEERAFAGISATVVEIPAGCFSIGDYAFMNCENLSRIRIPDSVTAIGEGVFARECDEPIYVFGKAGSAAQSYCENNDSLIFVAE